MTIYKNCHSGKFYPKNPRKFLGESAYYRSGLELSAFRGFFDPHSSVIEWASENIKIPYYNPHTGPSNYIPDIWARIKEKDGKIYEYIIEIKPSNKLVKPKTNQKKKFMEWEVNMAKFDAAKKYAIDNGMKWQILTDKWINGSCR
jgi:hypothetical protein